MVTALGNITYTYSYSGWGSRPHIREITVRGLLTQSIYSPVIEKIDVEDSSYRKYHRYSPEYNFDGQYLRYTYGIICLRYLLDQYRFVKLSKSNDVKIMGKSIEYVLIDSMSSDNPIAAELPTKTKKPGMPWYRHKQRW